MVVTPVPELATLLDQVTVITVTYNSSHCVPALAEDAASFKHRTPECAKENPTLCHKLP